MSVQAQFCWVASGSDFDKHPTDKPGTIESHGAPCPGCPIGRKRTRNTSNHRICWASGLSDLSGKRQAGWTAIAAATPAWRKIELVNTNGDEQSGTEIPKKEALKT